ncbi:antitermination protein [Escherichia coli]|uniref:antitermination protein Q n=8 Tax=Escherichia coli TaxID=562 RepID=UPI0018C65487|nr:antitermination protein [Escherichia coli]MCJ8425753.1 replication protein [Escherichia coli]MCJ8434823.1 replication protein [Escherichia coli]MCJ8453519.1 replication protein [Escherichia coli]MCK2561742.1 replication protein [Escherichia coli]HBJ0360270.1 replication protein [Escherichia coli]
MTNTAKILNFGRGNFAGQERNVADLDDGYARLSNMLLEAYSGADLTKRQFKVLLAILRRTYGWNMGMAQSQAGFGMAVFCGKHELSQNDKQKAINYLMQFAHKVSGKYRGVAKLEGNTKAKVLQVLATFAYADYCRSAATPGARCRDCHGTGRAVDIAKTELWGRVAEKECGRCKGVGYSRMPASAAYRAVTMLIPNLTQPTWSRTVKPLYDALVVQCHKEESIADNILNAITR